MMGEDQKIKQRETNGELTEKKNDNVVPFFLIDPYSTENIFS